LKNEIIKFLSENYNLDEEWFYESFGYRSK
jgi:hypothetical protein